MTRWSTGAADIDALVRDGSLERVTGAQADGAVWLIRASKILDTAQGIAEGDPESAYVLVYDATRHACVAVLAHQGLRATSKGGHYAVEQAVRAQFGPGFREFGTLRRRRNELEYPAYPGETIEPDELAQAIEISGRLQSACAQLLEQLSPF